MKTLIIIRHAKSSWAAIGEKDFDRPLNERGKKDATEMAEKLLNQSVIIDGFVCSPAKRTQKTCKAFMDVYGVKKETIVLVDELYNATEDAFYPIVSQINNDLNSVALFAHNPGVSQFANSLCQQATINEMPTCGVFAVQADIKNWKNFEKAKKKFLFFKFPKEE